MVEGAVNVLLRAEAGISARAYTGVIGQLTRALEEIDHQVNVDVRSSWLVTRTDWLELGARVQLAPSLKARTSRTTLEIERPGQNLWSGVRSLGEVPEIPATFTASIVQRVSHVRNQVKPSTGLLGVEVSPVGDIKPAEIDEVVGVNAEKAVHAVSLAYGSLVGRLDLISSRGKRKIGLRVDHGGSVMCEVENLDRERYMGLFEQRVIASGVVRRNLRGQMLSLVVDALEPWPKAEPLSARSLLGASLNLGGAATAVDYVRGRRRDG